MRDIVGPFFKKERTEKQEVLLSKGATVFWGITCVAFSFFVGDISDSIIVSINKIGSLANGPILATFLLGILTKRATDHGTLIGIIVGFLINLLLWLYVPQVSWLWWNVIGCIVTFTLGYLVSLGFPALDFELIKELVWANGNVSPRFSYKRNWSIFYGILVLYFVVIIGILSLF